MKVYGLTIINTDGFFDEQGRYRESLTYLFDSKGERNGSAISEIHEAWYEYLRGDDIDENEQTLSEVCNEFSERASAYIQLHFSHIQFEGFESEITAKGEDK